MTNPPLAWARTFGLPARVPVARIAAYVALAALLYTLVLCAWQCDDAYITFRTVKNFWSGFGLTWNPDERVQAYTHPLWMFVSLAAYGLTGEVFFSMTLVAIATSMATAVALWQLCATPAHFAVSVVVLIASRAFIDFSVCGLENPLLNGLLVASVITSLGDASRRGEWLRATCFAGVCLTRQDATLLVGPLWLALTWQRRAYWRWSLLGLAPIAAWELFSLTYYGALVPNTAFAKLNVALPASYLASEGFRYLGHSLTQDPITLVATTAAIVYAAIRGGLYARLLAAGAVLYLIYVVRIGGDFMTGRFLGAPLLVALCAANLTALRARATSPQPAWVAITTISLLYVVAWPHSPLRSTLDYGSDYKFEFLADERAVYYRGTGLLPVLVRYPELKAEGLPIPWVSTAEIGRAFALSNQRVTIRANVGVVGWHAGEKLVIDTAALADPLLARIQFKPGDETFRIGHYLRPLPDGYLESRVFGQNLIARRDLHEAYDALLLVLRGPLFTAERWRAIWRLNTGYYDAAFKNPRN